MAILSNEYVLGGVAIAVIIGGGIIYARTRKFFGAKKDE